MRLAELLLHKQFPILERSSPHFLWSNLPMVCLSFQVDLMFYSLNGASVTRISLCQAVTLVEGFGMRL